MSPETSRPRLDRIAFAPRNQHFWMSERPDGIECGTPASYYASIPVDERLSFDISNNKVLANMSVHGTVRQVCFYRPSYVSDDMPGVWMHKGLSTGGPFAFSLDVSGDEPTSLDAIDGTADFIDNVIPRFRCDLGGLDVSVFAFAPISSDGTERLPVLAYTICLRSRDAEVRGALGLPVLEGGDELFTQPGVSGQLLGGDVGTRRTPFSVAPGDVQTFTYVFYAPGEYRGFERIEADGVEHWLGSTLAYFRGMLGRLETEDGVHGALWERALLGCFNTIAMDPDGELAGGNWGSNPPTVPTWMKDLYYAALPFCLFEPSLAEKAITWFSRHGVRPRGARYRGGVTHSLGNSLSAALLAGTYFEYTRNGVFFRENPPVYEAICQLLDDLVAHRIGETWLFPSTWISDALSLGVAHTGSNICAWKAFSSVADIAEEAFGDVSRAARYREISDRIRGDVRRIMTCDGPNGPQYLEGVGAVDDCERKRSISMREYSDPAEAPGLVFLTKISHDGLIPLMMHDGEESDTTLMSFYGFEPRESDLAINTSRFAASSQNPTYSEEIRGIRWDGLSGATFPGFTTAYWSSRDRESQTGPEGRLTELVRLADFDGSWWWWPYPIGGGRGDVGRDFGCGKCAWAQGVFVLLYATQTLGIRYDAAAESLVLDPAAFGPSFEWNEARFGRTRLSASYDAETMHRELTLEPVEEGSPRN